MKRLRGRDLAAFFALSTLWSGNWLVIKIGLRSLPPLRFAGLRMVLACLFLLPLVVWRGMPRVGRRDAAWIALVGVLQIGVSYACVFTAEQWIESGLAALLFCSFPIWVGLLGHWLLPDEPLSLRTALAALLGICGVGIIEAPSLARVPWAGLHPLAAGGALMITSAVVSAFSVVTIKRRLAKIPARVNVWGQSIVAAVFLITISTLFERQVPSRWNVSAAGSLLYLSVVGTLIFLGSQWLISRVPVALMGSFPLLNTALALVWGTAIAGERVPGRVVGGGMLIFLGVGLVVFARSRRPAPRSS